MTKNQRVGKKFCIYRNGKFTHLTITAQNEEEAIERAIEVWGRWRIGPKHELTVKRFPKRGWFRERDVTFETENLSTEVAEDQEEAAKNHG